VAETAIEWTDATWNPVTGCDRVSPGCAHCYALTLAKRLKAMHNPRYQVHTYQATKLPNVRHHRWLAALRGARA
jgi:protein gp37